ncbi:MAG TPA: hypothetical protein VFI68_04390, partial [Anaerolineales bacterium]|nr:hypothetical protein [Anaerolineales bacterium]
RSRELARRDSLETAYLYCRGFDPTTIATTKNLALETVQSWIQDASFRFEESKRELSAEFNLTDIELQRLYKASRSEPLDAQSIEDYVMKIL